ncbi:YesL family protein [Ornithinibacillus contaminans]|uniref:YesL family protein n=1 Tax=Ornithinibacillus contaminans TaxID=694055 RepID=UPI00064D9565|nr:DUF624 domain-containing protein [Ornithinibacillus contaminans]
MNHVSTRLYTILEWITKFAYVNILWLTFTLLGGVVLGVFPSTIALFAIMREWLRGKTDIPVFQSYWNFFKQDFVKSNVLGIFITLIMVLIGLDILFVHSHITSDFKWVSIPLFSFMLVSLLFIFYIFPAFVHYELTTLHIIKNAFLIMLIHPINNLLILLCLVSAYSLMVLIPALFFIFGASIYAFITMWIALNAFNNVQEKKEN